MDIRGQFTRLHELTKALPTSKSIDGLIILKRIFSEYKDVLDDVHHSGTSFYEDHTAPFYSEVSRISTALHDVEHKASLQQRNGKFKDAVAYLKMDMQALAALIKRHEQ